MNGHLGKTPDSGWDEKVKKMKYRRHNYSTMYTPNRTLYAGRDYVIAAVRDGSNNMSNHSTIYANSNNYFFKKTRILTDMMGNNTQAQSFTMVIIVASIFFFCTIALTAALVIFCKKRNSVFALQKSEQDTDPDYEMDEYNTDMEFTETDYDSETDYHESFRMRSPGATNSPARQPLVSPSTPSNVRLVCSHGTQTGDPRGKYQQITSPCEHGVLKGDDDSDNDDIPLQSTHLKHPNKTYYAFAAVSSDANSDQHGCMQGQPMKTVPHADGPSNYNNVVSNAQQVKVAAETYTLPDNAAENNKHACSIYVAVEKGCDAPNGLYSQVNVAVKDQKSEKETELLATSQCTLHEANCWGDTTPLIRDSCDDNTHQSQLSPFTDILSSPLPSPMPELSLSPLTTKSPTDVQQSTSTKSQFSLFAADDTAVNTQDRRVETVLPRSTTVHKSETTSSIFTTEQRLYDQYNRAFVGSSETMLHESADATNASIGTYKAPVQVPNVRNHKLISRSVTTPVLSMKYTVCQK